jgi:hypothetical protein
MQARLCRAASAKLLLSLVVALSTTPAFAQSHLNGDWVGLFHEDEPERAPGPDPGDYTGLPLNAAGRLYADSWDASRLTLPEHQCRAHVSPYILRGPIRVRITEERNPLSQNVVAIRQFMSTWAQERIIWLDGRPHPSPRAPHSWMGFSTGEWQGDVLKVVTTHIKQGWYRRNGVPMSALAKMTEYFMRRGNILTQVSIIDDPVFLDEPLVRTTELRLDLNTRPTDYQRWLFCQADEEIPGRDPAYVPHYLPGQNPFMEEFAARFGLPVEAARGGVATMYPEYQQRLKTLPIPKPRPANDAERRR